ncbi:sensor histidine kinase [Microbacterium sp. ZW T5_56]|uniref:sensor histidine kinase n=1 Tax=Microbacterium sp. ZW T5_56 TaxID=3378081 RepID=UPI0038519C6D
MKKRLAQDALTAGHLAAVGFIGPFVLALLGTFAGVGIGLLLFLGVGLLFLALFAVSLAGVARFEELRVSGLYRFDLPSRALRRSPRADWLRVPHTLWLQVTDGRNWLGLLHFLIITCLGGVALWLLGSVASYLVYAIRGSFAAEPLLLPNSTLYPPNGAAALIAILAILACIAGVWGLTRAHRAISTAMLAPSRIRELERTVATETRRRDDAVSAATIERSRIERDLHDGVQPRLVSIGMTLGLARTKVESDPQAAIGLIDEAHTSTKAAMTELRQLARGFHPAVLEDRGLDAALSALAARSPIPVTLDVRAPRRYSAQIESAMYFAVAESITNIAKHSGATQCRVIVLERPGGMLWARIEDDGRGGARRVPGGGIDGISGRIAAAGGVLTLSSPVGGPTTIDVSLPCQS